MALVHRNSLTLLTALIAIALLAFAASPADSDAASGACKRWAKSSPEELRTGQARKAVLCLINAERSQRGLKPFDRNKKLQRAAQRHNDKMLGSGCFAHECSGEPSLDQRLDAYLSGDLLQWAYGENVAWGYAHRGAPAAIVDAWMNSAGHRANILSRDFREIGVGFSAGTPDSNNDPGGIYTTDFGLRVD